MLNPFKKLFKRGVTDPWHWISRLSGVSSSAGLNVTPDNALKVATVYACIKVISETLASLPFHLYKRDGKQRILAVNHTLYDLIHNTPNDYMTSFDWVETILTHLNLRGNAYLLRVNGAGPYVKGLLPLNPARMNPVIENNEVVYNYTDELGKGTQYEAERIWHIKNMPVSTIYNGNAPEGLLGNSPISLARESIGLAAAGDQYGGRYFANNATVGLHFSYPGKLSPTAKKNVEDSLDEYAQMENKFKNIVTQEGAKLERLSMSNEDSQFLQSRQFQIEEIARIFRVPPILLGHPTKTMPSATAEQMFLSFGKFTILPWCKRIEQSFNRFVLPEKDRREYFAEFSIDGLLRADLKTRYEAYGMARQWGLKNVDECRALENEGPLPDGKGQIYLQPVNMMEAGAKPSKIESKGE